MLLMKGSVQAQNSRTINMVKWGDDIGIENISFNNRPMIGYQTPNINCISKEGIVFIDYNSHCA